jgi:hypothetical protein
VKTPRIKKDQVSEIRHLPALISHVETGGRPAVQITPAGLAMVEHVAREGGAQSAVAAALGIALSTFKKQMSDNDEIRLRYEKGRAELEYEISTILLGHARKGNVVAALFYAKCQFSWNENAAPSTQVGVQIVLPDAMSREDFAKSVEVKTIGVTS